MFDFGNVIGIFDTFRWYRFIAAYSGNCLKPEEMFSGSLVSNIFDFDRGIIDGDEFYGRTRAAYRISVPNKADFYKKFIEILRIDYEMLGVVKDLKARGIITILVTNMNQIHAEHIGEKYPEIFASFDYLMISSREGIAKPDLGAFTLPLGWAGIEAGESILVDDSILNIRAACGLGIKGWHYGVTDARWCMNGMLDEERLRLKNHFKILDGAGLLYKK